MNGMYRATYSTALWSIKRVLEVQLLQPGMTHKERQLLRLVGAKLDVLYHLRWPRGRCERCGAAEAHGATAFKRFSIFSIGGCTECCDPVDETPIP